MSNKILKTYLKREVNCWDENCFHFFKMKLKINESKIHKIETECCIKTRNNNFWRTQQHFRQGRSNFIRIIKNVITYHSTRSQPCFFIIQFAQLIRNTESRFETRSGEQVSRTLFSQISSSWDMVYLEGSLDMRSCSAFCIICRNLVAPYS